MRLRYEARQMEFYAPEVIDELMCAFCFAQDQRQLLEEGLQSAAEKWFVEQNATLIDSKAARVKLENLDTALFSAAEALRGLEHRDWHEIGSSIYFMDQIPLDISFQLGGERKDAAEAVEIEYRSEDYDDFTKLPVEILADLLETIATSAHLAQDHLCKPGRKRDFVFIMWMDEIRRLWVRFLGRDFTFDAHKGEPVSQAAKFAVTAFTYLPHKLDERETLKKVRNYVDYVR